MNLAGLLPPEHVFVPLDARTLSDALQQMVHGLAARGAIRDAEALERLLAARPRDAVAIGDEVVLPHYRTDAVARLVVALGVAAGPLDATELGITTRPRIVTLILAPPETASLYLQTVSALARAFRDPGVVERIAAAGSAEDILAIEQLAELRIQPRLTVRDVMLPAREAVTPDTPLREAVELMIRLRLRALPVLGEKREVLGVVTERDLMRALLPQIPRAGDEAQPADTGESLRVRDAMSRSVLCVSEEMGLEEAVNMMINKDVEQFPVVAAGKLTGVLARGDIIRKVFGR